ncbi:MAG TPA: hypothetical protein VKK31_17475 [Thermoanaerobaculia bacterium]|nr:hypothetical protein [Thermoanaerobaculia bacterium]
MTRTMTGAMTGGESHAREQLREIVRELEAIRARLLGVQASLPAAAAEPSRLLKDDQDDQMDSVTEIRSTIGCVLLDWIGPAIRDLQTAAAIPYQPMGEP